ncbi:hypothetical protein MRX96_049334 [Rhipicephalus microplus]
MWASRISWWVEKHAWYHLAQISLRPYLGTENSLNDLTSMVNFGRRSSSIRTLLAMDVHKACDNVLETPVTTPIFDIKASSSSDSREPQASSESDVLTGEEEVIASEHPEPEALALPYEGVSGKQAVVLEYPLHYSLPVLAIFKGIPLQTAVEDFEHHIRRCRPPPKTTVTATMTKTDAAAHISYRVQSATGRVRPASNKGRGYPAMAVDVWLRHVGPAPCFSSPSRFKGEKERPHIRTKNAWTNEAPFVFGTIYPGSLGTRYDPQGSNAASRLTSSGGRRSSKARNTS